MSEASILSSEGIMESIQGLLAGHDFTECFEGMEDYLTQILNESILNAIFNAPVDDLGSHMFKRMNKKTRIHMIPGKEPVARVLSDAKKFVISIKDFYGSISRADIYDYLPHGEIREKEGGAGIGMYIVFKYSHKFVINVEPRKFTEMIFVIDKDKRFKWYSSKEKSFHLFMPS
jgi:sigma-B regulation protein RsbU (phosphoserine phosphatase)